MIKLSRINESRSAPIYHGTTYKNAYLILKSNELRANQSNETETTGISFTRIKDSAYDDVYLKIDQEQLNYNYMIKPVYRDGISGRDLAEERVPNTIRNISRYILEVDCTHYMKVNILRKKLALNYGNHDYVLKKPVTNTYNSFYYLYQLIKICQSKNIKLGKYLIACHKYLEMFLNDEHDIEYEARIHAKRSGKKLNKFNPY